MGSNNILDKYINNNLTFWKNKTFNEIKLINIINKYNLKIVKIEIKNNNIKILHKYNTKGNTKLKKAISFLQDVSNLYKTLNIILYLNISDTFHYENINIYNINGKKGNKEQLDDFVWGVSEKNNDYIRIVESEKIDEYNSSFPVFCFEKNRKMNSILFPTFGADNNNIKTSINIDNIDFSDKNIDTPIFRGKNICCDVSNLDKIKLINYSYNNPVADFKFCSNKNHSLWGKYIVSESFLKFCKSINIIDKDVDINKIREYFSTDNFENFDHIFNHKFIVTVGSAKNRKWYLSNSCILERKFKNKEFFHESIFENMEDIVYFTENNLKEKLTKLKENNYELSRKIIEKRKKKFNDYLHYPNLVKWYGKFLLEYQKITLKNE